MSINTKPFKLALRLTDSSKSEEAEKLIDEFNSLFIDGTSNIKIHYDPTLMTNVLEGDSIITSPTNDYTFMGYKFSRSTGMLYMSPESTGVFIPLLDMTKLIGGVPMVPNSTGITNFPLVYDLHVEAMIYDMAILANDKFKDYPGWQIDQGVLSYVFEGYLRNNFNKYIKDPIYLDVDTTDYILQYYKMNGFDKELIFKPDGHFNSRTKDRVYEHNNSQISVTGIYDPNNPNNSEASNILNEFVRLNSLADSDSDSPILLKLLNKDSKIKYVGHGYNYDTGDKIYVVSDDGEFRDNDGVATYIVRTQITKGVSTNEYPDESYSRQSAYGSIFRYNKLPELKDNTFLYSTASLVADMTLDNIVGVVNGNFNLYDRGRIPVEKAPSSNPDALVLRMSRLPTNLDSQMNKVCNAIEYYRSVLNKIFSMHEVSVEVSAGGVEDTFINTVNVMNTKQSVVDITDAESKAYKGSPAGKQAFVKEMSSDYVYDDDYSDLVVNMVKENVGDSYDSNKLKALDSTFTVMNALDLMDEDNNVIVQAYSDEVKTKDINAVVDTIKTANSSVRDLENDRVITKPIKAIQTINKITTIDTKLDKTSDIIDNSVNDQIVNDYDDNDNYVSDLEISDDDKKELTILGTQGIEILSPKFLRTMVSAMDAVDFTKVVN